MKQKILITLVLSVVAGNVQAQNGGERHLMFNEVMQSNIDYLMVDRDFPDSWVELYNPTDADIRIDGMQIGEHEDGRNAYTFADTGAVVPAGGHLVIYCDKENRGLHTSFRIDSGKASLYLFDPTGSIIDALSLPKMPAANVAYGRITDGAEKWQYEVEPTAGSANASVGAASVLPAPEFSVAGGVCSEAFCLTLSMPTAVNLPADTRLFYTLDGSEPTRTSPSTPNEVTLSIGESTVVRAKLMSQSALSDVSTVQSYIFHPRATALPVVSIVTNEAYIFGEELGIASATLHDGTPNYMQQWRRPINIEYYDMRAGGKVAFNQLGETAISGVSTREQPQKSFKVYANKRFGKKTYKGDFWPDKPEVTKVKSFVLRSGGNNSFTTRINDALVQRIFGTHLPGLDWQAYQPVVLYINGEYAGEYGMRERSNEDFVEANYGVEEVEMADEESYQNTLEGTEFAVFRSAYQSTATTYTDLDGMMDVDNFTKALVAEMYAMNTDFPTNNVSMWRSLEESDTESTISNGATSDGKWRWILKDLDRAGMNVALYPADFDMFSYLFSPDELLYAGMHHFDLYTKMAEFEEFREHLADLLVVCLGDFLKPRVVSNMADAMSNEIYDELRCTFLTYGCEREWEEFDQRLEDLKGFFAARPAYLYRQASDYLNLGGVIPLTIANDEASVSLNGMLLTEGDFDGACFAKRRIMLDNGSEYKGWRLTVTDAKDNTAEYIFKTSFVSFLPADYTTKSSARMHLEPYALSTGVVQDASSPIGGSQQVYDTHGIRQTTVHKGISIVKGKKIATGL